MMGESHVSIKHKKQLTYISHALVINIEIPMTAVENEGPALSSSHLDSRLHVEQNIPNPHITFMLHLSQNHKVVDSESQLSGATHADQNH
jgi:hypothetical protein